MKFIHTADCHIGAWRDPKMKQLTHDAWLQAVDEFIAEKPDFIVLAGDFFNTAVPGIDSLKVAVKGLQKIKEAQIPVYAIAGSHDYSASGKTMLDVLEQGEFLTDVMRGSIHEGKLRLEWTQDKKTSVKLAGILGRRGNLDKHYYEDLDRDYLEQDEGEKIFLFHTSISELKPKAMEKMESQPASFLPKGCKYYAGGHVHITQETSLPGYDNIVYPGPLFPASFSELEELCEGSYCVVTDWKMERRKLSLKPIINTVIDAQHKSPSFVEQELAKIDTTNDAIVLIRIHGELSEGKPSDIDFTSHMKRLYAAGAYFVMKNTTQLTSKEYEEFHISSSTPEQLEDELITEHLGQSGLDAGYEKELTRDLMRTLCEEQKDGEKKYTYEERVIAGATKILRR